MSNKKKDSTHKNHSTDFAKSFQSILRSMLTPPRSSPGVKREPAPQPKGGSNPKPTISRNKIRSAEQTILDFYTLQSETPLSEKIRGCYLAKMAVQNRQEAGQKAKVVLDGFYQSGKILDLLNQFSAFAQQVEQSSSLEIARMKGYCNYLFFAEDQVKKLLGAYTPFSSPTLPDAAPIDPRSVADFLARECGSFYSVRRLQNLKEIAETLQQKEKFFVTDYDDYVMLLERLPKIDHWTEEELQSLEELQDALEQQLAAIEGNIQKANEIYRLLQELLPQSWFDSMNYELEDCPIANMEMAELKAYYDERLHDVREKLLNQYEK